MLFLISLWACGGGPEARPPVDPAACFEELVTKLSADEMEGRGVGTEGLEKAASLLEERWKVAGLADGGVGHRQPFQAVTGVKLGPDNRLEDLELEADWAPLGFSSSGTFSGEVVFAGYGIVAPDLGYDDYAGLDVKGKVVLAMRYEPGETDEKSPFDGRKASRWSDLRYKALKAREAGAAALVLVAPARQPDEADKVPPLVTRGAQSRAGIPVLQVSRAVADRWLASAGADLATLRAEIDAETKPRSKRLPGVSVSGAVDVVPTEATVRNVLGVLPGEGDLADEVVIVGAHYDHLGRGDQGSMRPDSHEIHNGADDNASGTSAMVCAVSRLASQPPPGPRRTLVAVGFAGEEIGLLGSAHYTDHPVLPLDRTVAMVNLDMVGRVKDGKLSALGSDTAPEWKDLLTAAGSAAGLEVGLGGDGYGPSDQTSFYEREIPVVHLFSGAHEQYHTPEDDAPTINVAGGAQVTTLLEGLLTSLTTREDRLTYVEATTGPRVAGDSRGYGAWLGTVPNFQAMEATTGGVLLDGVRKGGPAELSGIEKGDVLVGIGGSEVQNLSDMSFLLQDHKPGETVDVVVLRGAERKTFRVTLGDRSKMDTSGGHGHGQASANHRLDHGDFSIGAEHPKPGDWAPTAGKPVPELLRPEEKHLADLRQLTFGGENAEAYWGPGGRKVSFQRTPAPGTCDAQYSLDLTTGAVTLISSGKGRTTCGYWSYPEGDRYIYATTEAAGPECPPPPDHSQGYVWPLYPSFDMVWQVPGKAPEPFLAHEGYDAEATACQQDGRIVFTSTRDGDLELYLANADGSGLERVTETPGYDGGAFFTTDCSALVWRASRPEGEALADYRRLLDQDLVRPSSLEIFWMELDTRKVEQLTSNGAANFAPYPLPDDSGVLYASNAGGSGREFDVWLAKRAGGEPERITTTEGFDGFPMFSPDGKWLMFASNRATAPGASDTNLFVARWVP